MLAPIKDSPVTKPLYSTISLFSSVFADVNIIFITYFMKVIIAQIANEIKAHGGNGILDLKIEYGLIGLGGDSFQITAMGMGVKFKD